MIVIVPMAGRGSRYANQGFDTPKPLIDIAGKPMLWYAFQSLSNVSYAKIVFIALKEHQEKYGLSNLIKEQIVQSFELILLDEPTEGQLCTVMTAEKFFRAGEGLLIASSDTYVVSNLGKDIAESSLTCDGIISTANLPGDRWSFAKTDSEGIVTEVAEKARISDHASTGLYYFSDAKYFGREAEKMIRAGERTKGEFYVIPLYNNYIREGRKIKISTAGEMWDLGTPEAKRNFEMHLQSKGGTI